MRVCIDTNALVQLFGTATPFGHIADALQRGRLEVAVSNEILLEYEQTLATLSGPARWQTVWRFLEGVSRLHNNVLTWSRISRSEEHTSELQSLRHLVCRLL